MLRMRLQQGRYRQIRRMCELVDLKVVDLVRRRIARYWFRSACHATHKSGRDACCLPMAGLL